MLRFSASLADSAAVSLGEAVTDIDDCSIQLLVIDILRASDRPLFPSRYGIHH